MRACVLACVRACTCVCVCVCVCVINAKQKVTRYYTRMPDWDGVRGCHGVGKMSENGEALLSFYALNELVCVCVCVCVCMHAYITVCQ